SCTWRPEPFLFLLSRSPSVRRYYGSVRSLHSVHSFFEKRDKVFRKKVFPNHILNLEQQDRRKILRNLDSMDPFDCIPDTCRLMKNKKLCQRLFLLLRELHSG